MLNSTYRIYYENAVGRVVDDPLGFARLTYQSSVRVADSFHAFLGHVTRLMARRGDGCLLVDQRRMSPFTPDEQRYVIEQWLPRTVQEGGYRYGAVIVAEDVFARLATASVVTAVRELPMQYRYFEQEAEAIAWLLHQQRQG
ncbi:STAS/SEC14 domain-containing protein [Hymenobacter volaticus]|uniref:STAS/SEC14 domain-containing protein n=1 Tax=Hymenobacter volaticus TaxID=2932254 RepID=A0ABY4GEE5_9BACT|nr:STAS/SEC14 domain-containing protein [Hymenobacter volaticus]UOQ69228.1 hypothetical protein MUN86_27630 [Hymenobacter volaticus]